MHIAIAVVVFCWATVALLLKPDSLAGLWAGMLQRRDGKSTEVFLKLKWQVVFFSAGFLLKVQRSISMYFTFLHVVEISFYLLFVESTQKGFSLTDQGNPQESIVESLFHWLCRQCGIFEYSQSDFSESKRGTGKSFMAKAMLS